MNMTLLKSYLAIVDNNSISQAAEKLHITQPGLSMQLKNLEDIVGSTLLIRNNRGVQMTEEGKIVYDYGLKMLALEDELYSEINQLQNKKELLHISSCTCLGFTKLPNIIYEFSQENPNVEVFMNTIPSGQVIQKLKKGETKLGIITSKLYDPEIEYYPIREDNLMLVGKFDAELDEIDIKDVKEIPLVLREEDSNLTKILRKGLETFNQSYTDMNIVMSANSSQLVKSAVIAGTGYAFLPGIVVSRELEDGYFKEIKVKNLDTDFNYYLVHKKDYILNEHEKRFIEFITSRKDLII